jgi:hypothetical protein
MALLLSAAKKVADYLLRVVGGKEITTPLTLILHWRIIKAKGCVRTTALSGR